MAAIVVCCRHSHCVVVATTTTVTTTEEFLKEGEMEGIIALEYLKKIKNKKNNKTYMHLDWLPVCHGTPNCI